LTGVMAVGADIMSGKTMHGFNLTPSNGGMSS
jgi:hypothetical protein